jgi:hypothetical protein
MTGGTLAGRRSVVVSTLGITQTLAWGSTYYLPAVFADPMADALHLSRGSSAFSLAPCCSRGCSVRSPAG